MISPANEQLLTDTGSNYLINNDTAVLYDGAVLNVEGKSYRYLMTSGVVDVYASEDCCVIYNPIQKMIQFRYPDGTEKIKRVSEHDHITPVRQRKIFINAQKRHVGMEGMYSGASCFLVCGGPSLNEKGFDYYNSMLSQPGIISMGINNITNFIRTNLWIANDMPGRFSYTIWTDPRIMKFTPIYRVDQPLWSNELQANLDRTVSDCPGVVYFRPHTWGTFKESDWFGLNRLMFGYQTGKGSRSTFLLALHALYYLGFENVYLVGCDFYMDKENKYAFSEQRTGHAIRSNNSLFNMCREVLASLQVHFKRIGFNVYNCNPKSHLKVFPFKDFEGTIKKHVIKPQKSCFGYYVCKKKKQNQPHIELSGPFGDGLCALPAIAEFKKKTGQSIVLTSKKQDMAEVLYASGIFDELKSCVGIRPKQGNHLDLRQRFAKGFGVKLKNSDIPELAIAPEPPKCIKNYVIICPEASGPKRAVRQVDDKLWVEIVKFLHSQDYSVIQVGKDYHKIPGIDLDLVNKTTLRELAGIIKASRFIVSVDTGVFHLAHALRIPQVVLFTVSDKSVRQYSNTYPLQLDDCHICRSKHVKPVTCPEGHFKCGQFSSNQVIETINQLQKDLHEE